MQKCKKNMCLVGLGCQFFRKKNSLLKKILVYMALVHTVTNFWISQNPGTTRLALSLLGFSKWTNLYSFRSVPYSYLSIYCRRLI